MKALRLPLLLVKLSVIAIAAWGLALYPGDVQIEWLGYHLHTGVEVAIAAILVFSALMVTINMLWRWIREIPSRLQERRLASRKNKGDQIILQALSAIAAGDGKLADKLVNKAKAYNSNNLLNDIVAAQASHISGDQKESQAKFTKLLENSQTEFLGLRGLIIHAQAQGDWQQVRTLLEKALKHFSNSPWLLEQLYRCNLELSDYDELPPLIDRLGKLGLINEKDSEASKGLLRWCEAEKLRCEQPRKFIKKAETALRLLPGHTHIALAVAEAYVELNEASKAFRTLRSAFEINPHHDLLQLMRSTLSKSKKASTAEEFYTEVERLAGQELTNSETIYCLALTAMQAKLWGQARKHLKQLVGLYPTKRVFMLLMQLEAQEFPGEKTKQDGWLVQMTTAKSDPGWSCSSCGAHQLTWRAVCSSCKSLGSINYGAKDSNKSSDTRALITQAA